MNTPATLGSAGISPLIDADALHAVIGAPDWLVADCRHQLADPDYGRRAYAAGHIPGAIFLHLDDDLSGPHRGTDGRFRGRHPLPDRGALAVTMARAGLTPSTTLVAYDDGDSMVAARLWWLALWLGHSRVAVLDGGLAAWHARGNLLSTDVPVPRSTVAAPIDTPPLVQTVDAEVLMGNLDWRRFLVLDARGADRYRGEVEPMDTRAGHVPGAHNRPFRSNLRDDNRFKAAAQLRDEFTQVLAGMPADAVIHQCGSGVSACHNLLAMAVASLPGGRLYPGSWSEWSADPAKPVSTGAAP